MTEQSQYFLESYVPSHLTLDAGYVQAYKDRMTALMEMQEYNIDEIGEPFIRETPDCPAVPGMCVFRVEAVVREYDIEVPMDDDDDEDDDMAWTPFTATASLEVPPESESLVDSVTSQIASMSRELADKAARENMVIVDTPRWEIQPDGDSKLTALAIPKALAEKGGTIYDHPDGRRTFVPNAPEFEEFPPSNPVNDSTLALAAQIAKGITTRSSAED